MKGNVRGEVRDKVSRYGGIREVREEEWKSEGGLSLTKHSAASSMMPSWKRCSSWKVLARALRSASDGNTFSLLNWNWAKIL